MKKRFLFATLMAALFTTATFTACEDDDDDDDSEVLATNVDFSNLTTVAQTDGKIIIEGSITANGKIKKFELQDLEGKTIVDLATKNEKSVEKDENGKKVKTFTMDINSVAVSVQEMQLVFKVKDGDTGKGVAKIGEKYNFHVGTTKSSAYGSYMSIVGDTSYFQNDIFDKTTGIVNEELAKTVELYFDKEDGKFIIKSAKENAPIIKANEANGRSAEQAATIEKNLARAIVEEAVVTSTNCVATYTITPVEGDEESALVSGGII